MKIVNKTNDSIFVYKDDFLSIAPKLRKKVDNSADASFVNNLIKECNKKVHIFAIERESAHRLNRIWRSTQMGKKDKRKKKRLTLKINCRNYSRIYANVKRTNKNKKDKTMEYSDYYLNHF